MAKLKSVVYWREDLQSKVPEGCMVIQYHPSYLKNAREEFRKLKDKQKENIQAGKGRIPLNQNLEIWYKPRTLKMNNLMWGLYEIEAVVLNGDLQGHPNDMVSANDRYKDDLKKYAPKYQIKLPLKYAIFLQEEYHVIGIITHHENKLFDLQKYYEESTDREQEIVAHVIAGSSHFDTKFMCKWIERQFNRLSHLGVPLDDASKIKDFWIKFNNYKNKNKIITEEGQIMTQKEYKDLHPDCEGCSEYIEHAGQLAHIRAVGMGNDRKKEPRRNYSDNWLHLCHKCHVLFDNGFGVQNFLKSAPWLQYKIETALKKEFDPNPLYEDEEENIEELELF